MTEERRPELLTAIDAAMARRRATVERLDDERSSLVEAQSRLLAVLDRFADLDDRKSAALDETADRLDEIAAELNEIATRRRTRDRGCDDGLGGLYAEFDASDPVAGAVERSRAAVARRRCSDGDA